MRPPSAWSSCASRHGQGECPSHSTPLREQTVRRRVFQRRPPSASVLSHQRAPPCFPSLFRPRAPPGLRAGPVDRRHARLVAADTRCSPPTPWKVATPGRAGTSAPRVTSPGWLAAAGVKPLGRRRIVVPVGADGGGRRHPRAPRRRRAAAPLPARRHHPRGQAAPSTLEDALAYRGYCGADALGDVRGKLVICHAARRPGLPTDEQRRAALQQAGAIGMIAIADPGFTIEPPRWPAAYARSVTLAGGDGDAVVIDVAATSAPRPAFVTLSLRAEALRTVLAGSGQDADSLIAAGSAGRPLPSLRPARPPARDVHHRASDAALAERRRDPPRDRPDEGRRGDRPHRAPRRLRLRDGGERRLAVQRDARRRGVRRPDRAPHRAAPRRRDSDAR